MSKIKNYLADLKNDGVEIVRGIYEFTLGAGLTVIEEGKKLIGYQSKRDKEISRMGEMLRESRPKGGLEGGIGISGDPFKLDTSLNELHNARTPTD